MTKNLDYKKVLVGVSGGVDSSVCIDLLKKQGLEVEGVVIRFSPESDEAVTDAQKVCDKLGITLHVADAQADFKKYVVTPFCENYVSGKTPNPCIVCNPHVKFATLIKTADELGIGYIATGHYAQVEKVGETYFVKKAVSVAKDQSYMLYRLPQEILSRLILPIGSFEKPEIREMAGELELFNADKPDSQEICFIPDGNHGQFIEEKGYKYFEMCAPIVEGTKEVIDAVAAMLSTLPPVRKYESEEIPLETLLSKQNTGFEITVEDDVYIVEAPFLIKILCRTDLDDYESLQYFQRVLISSGIIDALREKGIQEGDIVSVYDFEFEFVD